MEYLSTPFCLICSFLFSKKLFPVGNLLLGSHSIMLTTLAIRYPSDATFSCTALDKMPLVQYSAFTAIYSMFPDVAPMVAKMPFGICTSIVHRTLKQI